MSLGSENDGLNMTLLAWVHKLLNPHACTYARSESVQVQPQGMWTHMCIAACEGIAAPFGNATTELILELLKVLPKVCRGVRLPAAAAAEAAASLSTIPSTSSVTSSSWRGKSEKQCRGIVKHTHPQRKVQWLSFRVCVMEPCAAVESTAVCAKPCMG